MKKVILSLALISAGLFSSYACTAKASSNAASASTETTAAAPSEETAADDKAAEGAIKHIDAAYLRKYIWDYKEEPSKFVFKGLEGIVKNGPSAEYFDKAVKNLKKAHGESLRKNSYWLGQLARFYGQGFDFVTNYDKLLDAVTPQSVQALAKKLYESKDRTEILFRSTEAKK